MAESPTPDAKGKYVTLAGVTRALTSVAGVIAALQTRVTKLEAKLRAIEAAPGAVSAAALDRLERTLRAPVVPIYDERGRLTGAKRQVEGRDVG